MLCFVPAARVVILHSDIGHQLRLREINERNKTEESQK